jgi:hypothetical protein
MATKKSSLTIEIDSDIVERLMNSYEIYIVD